MPSIQQNHERSFIKNAKSGRRCTLTLLGTTLLGGGFDKKCSYRLVVPICRKGLYEGKQVGIGYITEWNNMIVDLFEPEEHIIAAIIGEIKFHHTHSQDYSLRDTVNGCYWHWSALSLYIGGRGQFLGERGAGTSWMHRLGVSRVVTCRTHVAKC